MIDYILCRINTVWLRLKLSFLGVRIEWGKNVRITGSFSVKGEGLVIIGDNVRIYGTGHPVTPFTHSKDAIIRIGKNCFLNGTRFGCANSIEIGDDCILADTRIMDTDFHPVDPVSRLNNGPCKVGKVVLGNNVWVGAGSFILRDTHIGSGSVIGAGAVVSGQYTDNELIIGNPAKVVKSLKA